MITRIPQIRQPVHSSLNWVKGIAELASVGAKPATLSIAQELRARFEDEGKNLCGRTATGIGIVPAGYVEAPLFGKNEAQRAILPVGLCVYNPKEAVDANARNEWYSPSDKQKALECLAQLGIVRIRESDVNSDVLELPFDKFEADATRDYAFALFGGEGTEEEQRARVIKARDYFQRHLPTKQKVIQLYLPQKSLLEQGKLIGTQIWQGGLGSGFQLSGNGRLLDLDYGVFGVL